MSLQLTPGLSLFWVPSASLAHRQSPRIGARWRCLRRVNSATVPHKTQITARQASHHREAHGGTRRAASLVEHGLLGVEVERHHARNRTGTNGPPTRSTRARRPRLDLSRPWPELELLTPSRFPDCRVMKKRQFDDIGSPNRAQLLGTSSARPVSTGVCSDDAMSSGSWTSDN